MSSGPDSMTREAAETAASKSAQASSRPRARAMASPGARPFSRRTPASPRALARPAAAVSGARLTMVERTPPKARLRAMPGPIMPVPMTAAEGKAGDMTSLEHTIHRRDAETPRKILARRESYGTIGLSPVLVERDLVDSSLKAYAHPGTGNRSGRREGHAAISAHEGKGQTGRTVRGQVSHHRLRSEQFHQFGNLLGLRADAVPQPVAAAAPERGLAVRGTAEDAVRHSGAGADAVAGRDVGSGDGGRNLPEHQPGGAVRPACGGDLRRRPHLPHERDEHDRIPRAAERGDHGGGDSGAEEARGGVRGHRDVGGRAHSGVP